MQAQHKFQKKSSNKIVLGWSLKSAYTKNKIISALLFFLAFFIIGGTNYAIMFHIFVPTIFPLDFFVGLFLVSPIFFFKGVKFDRIYLPIVVALITTCYCFNAAFYAYFGTVFALKDFVGAIENAEQVGMHGAVIKGGILILNFILVVIFDLAIIFYNVFGYFVPTKAELKTNSKRKITLALSMMVGSAAGFEFTLQMWCISQRNSNYKDIDYVNYSPNHHMEKAGLIGYYTQEIRQLLFDKGMSYKTIKEYCNDTTMPNDQFTGCLSQGDIKPNIIVITIETGDDCMLYNYDKEADDCPTPNLYNFLHDGVYCDKNYSGNHTDVTDAILMTGNFPLYHFHNGNDFNSDFNLPHILRNNNYQSIYTHDIVSSNDIYHRMDQMDGAGFSECGYHNDVIPTVIPGAFKKHNFTRDSIYVNGDGENDGLINKLKTIGKEKPFYLHYLSVHMHENQQITKGNEQMYLDLEDEFGERLDKTGINPFDPDSSDGKKCRRFMLKSMDFDKALGSFMNYLYESNDSYLNNTLMCICADHPGYENSSTGQKFCAKLRQINDINNIKQFKTILGFYHPVLNQKFQGMHGDDHRLGEATGPTVVVPTILDLINNADNSGEHLYNPCLYLSKSIFDGDYDNEVFYSFGNERFMNEHYTSYNHHSISDKYDDDQDEEDFLKKLDDARFRLRMIDTIYKRNIFKKYPYEEFMPLN